MKKEMVRNIPMREASTHYQKPWLLHKVIKWWTYSNVAKITNDSIADVFAIP